MAVEQMAYQIVIFGIIKLLNVHHFGVASNIEVIFFIQDEGHPATHPSRKVSSSAADDDYDSPGHILAAVVACALNHSMGARISHGKAFSHLPADVGLAA